MKKIMLLTVALTLVVNAFSQISYGVKAGVNFASMTNIDDSKMRFGYAVDVVAEYPFRSVASHGAELSHVATI